jgi:hypothetical protein
MTNEIGEIQLNSALFKSVNFLTKNLIISSLGYNSLSINFPKKDTTVYLTTNVIQLGEVIVESKTNHNRIIGNYKKKSLDVFVNSIDDINSHLKVVNLLNYSGENLTSVLFYIAKDENYKGAKDVATLEIVFYNQILDGKPNKSPFFTKLIKDYSVGWNKVNLNGLDLTKISGNLFYGINWVYDSNKYHYKNIRKKRVYTFFGPKLGTTNSYINEGQESYYYTDKFGWKKLKATYVMLALEILN